ncbi:hypothetical protein [Methylosinus sporium]|uniref:hypothetical protein n=1 Tax=Methylosinus sporium TaxID=428 RepID=UPI003F68654F
MSAAESIADAAALVRVRIGSERIEKLEKSFVRKWQMIGIDAVFSEELPIGSDGVMKMFGQNFDGSFGLIADEVYVFLRAPEIGGEAHQRFAEVDE